MKIRILLAVTSLLLSALPVAAAELTLVPSIGYGFSDLTFTRSTGEADISRFNIVDLGLTAVYGKAYARVGSEVPMGQDYTYGPTLIRQFKREDASFSAGYYVFEQLSVFGGYAYGKTSIINSDGGGGLPPYPVYTQHRDSGMFVGANYSIYVGNSASIGLNLAYANMDGRLVVQDTNPGVLPTTENGKTTGYSLGLTWSDKFKNKLNYYVSYKQKNYKTELETISVNKNFSILSFGILFPI